MEAKAVDVGRSLSWFSCGWRVFMKNPGIWVVLGIVFLVIFVVLSFIPVLGAFAATLLAPVLGAGLLQAARESDEGREPDVGTLFQGFKDKTKLTPLLSLGGVALGGMLVSMAIIFAVVGGRMLAAMQAGGKLPAAGMDTSFLLALLIILAVQLLVAMALAYAVPLVMFRGAAVGAALRSSVNACLRNILPLFVFGVAYFVVAIVATIPFGLGWPVLLPWSVGMIYCSYKDLYESP
jgi:hypothetical protein